MTVALDALVPLYLLFVLKQLLADFLLQTEWMAVGKGAARRWLAPLLAHAGIHAGLTLLLALLVAPALWWLGPLDLLVHAGIDRTKGALTRRLTPGDRLFWWALGTDQALHQVTHFLYVVALLAARG